MAKLIYSLTSSVDGFIEDASGSFEWSEPDEEVLQYVNDQLRPVGTFLFGRRMYETMRVWDALPAADASPGMRDFAALWRGADKVVYSASLPEIATARTRLERTFDADAVRAMKASAARDLEVGGAALAAAAIRAGLVDELVMYLAPIVVGGGKRWLPEQVRLHLDLLDEHHFASGVVHARYAVR